MESLIVSMASYPPRISSVAISLVSLFEQSLKPDKILLWLYRGEFPGGLDGLPRELVELQNDVFQIMWTDINLKPHNKYFWTLQAHPDAMVVTVDDDLVYHPSMLEDLVNYHREYPGAIIANRTHMMTFSEDGSLAPYGDWLMEQDVVVGRPSLALFATNGAGALFPPHVAFAQSLDADEIVCKSLFADDLWLKALELQMGMPVVATGRSDLHYVPDTQACGLWSTVNEQGGNDKVLARISDLLAPAMESVKDDCFKASLALVRCYSRYREENRRSSVERATLEERCGLAEREAREARENVTQWEDRCRRALARAEKLTKAKERSGEKIRRLRRERDNLKILNARYEERLKTPYFFRLLGRCIRKIQGIGKRSN